MSIETLENLCKALLKQAKELNFAITGIIVINEGGLYWFDNKQNTQSDSAQNIKTLVTVKGDISQFFYALNSNIESAILGKKGESKNTFKNVSSRALHFTQTNPQVLYTYH
ncbi:hypothetical protein [Candidatus Photodesmus blepharus]|uniref:hypothetical protein n=1 Tax=Candidatus Photodesmus blepharonis TaxID=1179155 RepID=UPI000556FB42|nr:hypothetical protein [Candidatus Photodesmus blepharus]